MGQSSVIYYYWKNWHCLAYLITGHRGGISFTIAQSEKSQVIGLCTTPTLSQPNLLKFDRVRNGGLRVILGITKDTSVDAMHHLLDLPLMETRCKMEQVKAYLNAMHNSKNPLHDAVKEEKGWRLASGKSWMGQVDRSIQHVCGFTELTKVRDWEKKPCKVQALLQDCCQRI